MIAISFDSQQCCSRRSGARQAAARLSPARARHQPHSARGWRLKPAVEPQRRANGPCWTGTAFRMPYEDEL